jgi:HK97 family phage portal protein
MQIRIPFTKSVLYLGKNEVKNVKEAYQYGFWQNGTSDMFKSGGYRVGFSTLYNLHNSVVDIKRCVSVISDTVMKAGFAFINASNESLAPNLSEMKVVQDVFSASALNFTSLKRQTMKDLGIAANAYWLLQKNMTGSKVLKIVIIDPRTMSVVSDKFGNVKGYVQRVGGSTQEFTADEIVHFVVDFSTNNPLLGVSPIESVLWEARTELAAQTSNYYFYENASVPAHLLILEEDISEEQMAILKKDVDAQFKGSENRHKSGLIPFVKDIKTITPSQKDMQFLETRLQNTGKICVAYGVDKFVLGYTDKVQRGNADVIYKMFYENTIRPIEMYFEEVMNKKVLPALGLTKIKFKVKPSNYDNAKEVADITRADVMTGIMTVNEARQVRGLEPLDNELADEIMFNGMPIDDFDAELRDVQSVLTIKNVERRKNMLNLLEL